MSIQVNDLTKKFEEQVAVDSLSFSIEKGEVLGFLGPNGAGKSTTMNMLAGYLVPTSGAASIHGIPISKATAVKKRIGFLPEHNPLYPELYIKESLEFVAKLHEIPVKEQRKRIQDVIELTGLSKEQHKKVNQISKGYKQRLGLAQAILHEPDVLILDEPTSGLDPNQLVEVRALIKTLSEEKTVILSSHIMQEVEALCSSILLIADGHKKAFGSIEEVTALIQGNVTIRIECNSKNIEWISTIPEVTQVLPEGKGVLITASKDIRSKLFTEAVNQNQILTHISLQQQGLEDVFRSLTQS